MIKKLVLYTFALSVGFIFMDAAYKTSGGHPSSTGAPGEKTCAQPVCHDDGSVIMNSDKNKFTFDNFSTSYIPGKTYDISLELDLSDIQKAGFQIVAIDSAKEENIGTWVLTQPDRMHIMDGELPNDARKYITHSTKGSKPLSGEKNKWQFKWTAPNQLAGTIRFYMAINATNNNDETTGDKIHLSNYTIRPHPSTDIKPVVVSKPSVLIGKNSIKITNIDTKNAELIIYNLEGKKIFFSDKVENNSEIEFNLLSLRLNTIYLYQLRTPSETIFGKFQI